MRRFRTFLINALLFLIPLLAVVWLLTVRSAKADYDPVGCHGCGFPGTGAPGTTGNSDTGSNTGYPGSTDGSNTGYPGSTDGSDTGSNTGYPGDNTGNNDGQTGIVGGNNGSNNGYPGNNTGSNTGYPGSTDGSNTGSNTGYPGGGTNGNGTSGNNTGSNTGYPGGNTGSNTGYPGGNTGSNTGYPGGNTGSNTGYPGGNNGGTGTGYPGSGTNGSGYPGSGTDGTGTVGTGDGGTITPGHWDVSYKSEGVTKWHYLTSDNTAHADKHDWPTAASGDQVRSDSYLDASAKGSVTGTLTWVPATGQDSTTDPPSSSVIVTEYGSASASGWGNGPATADDGWGDSSGDGGMSSGSSSGPAQSRAFSSGTHYEVKDGSSGTITITKSLSAASPDNTTPDANGNFYTLGASVAVSLALAGDSTTIGFGGVNATNQALTGQQVSATVIPPPGYIALGALTKWSISSGNDVFYTYNEKAATHQLVLLSDSANYTTGSTLKFYDKAAESVTIKCDTTLVGPDGTLTPVTALQSQPVSFLKPTVKWFIDTGFVQPATPGFFYLLSDPAKGYPGGENWRDINISVPQPFSGGKGCIAQLVKPDLEVLQDTAPFTLQDANNKKKGLDNSFPYPGSLWDLPAHGNQSDRPGLGVAGLNQNGYEGYNTAFRTDNFDTWVMYKPSGAGSVWVPLQKYSWSWSCTLKWQNDQWTKTASSPADATQDPHYQGADSKDPPTWNLVQNNAAH